MSVQELCKKVTLLDAIGWTVQAWKDVKSEIITRCFNKAGFCGESGDSEEADTDEDSLPLSVLAERLALRQEELLEFDNNLETEDDTVTWEQALIDRHRQPDPEEAVLEDDDP